MLIHKSIINKAGYFPEDKILRGIEDYAYWLRIVRLTKTLYIEESLVFYFDNSIDSIRKESEIKFEDQRRLVIKNYNTWLKNNNLYNFFNSISFDLYLFIHNTYVHFFYNKFFKKC